MRNLARPPIMHMRRADRHMPRHLRRRFKRAANVEVGVKKTNPTLAVSLLHPRPLRLSSFVHAADLDKRPWRRQMDANVLELDRMQTAYKAAVED